MGSQVFMDFVLIKSIPWWKHKIAVHSKGLSEHCTHTNFQYNGSGVILSWNYTHVGHKNSKVKISNINKMVYS